VSNTPDEFVTVAEAARRLGISDRQALRYVRRVSDADRQESEGSPTRVRLAAVITLRGERQSVRPASIDMSDAGPTHDGHTSDAAPTMSDTLIEQLQARLRDKEAENARLWSALEREQETARAALRELNEERQRGMIMLAATAAGKIGPLDGTEAGLSNEQNTSNDAPGGTEASETGQGGVSVGSEAQEAKAEAKPAQRRWWQLGRS